MFAKSIIDSDLFLDMPATTQMLYFHLAMRADDDGFINNPKRIMRMIGSSDDDMRILIAKQFIILFESGIVVIRHWKIHNYIRSDRYKPSVYKEKKQLKFERGLVYQLDDECQPSGIPDDNQSVSDLDTQDRLGKDRLDKDRINIYISPLESESAFENCSENQNKIKTVDEIVNLYHEICKSYPRLRGVSENRRKAITARCKIYSIDDFRIVFQNAENSRFLKGGNDRNWSANFDWMMKDTNFVKILEGRYNGKRNGTFDVSDTRRGAAADATESATDGEGEI